jgi:hypothetical protein
MSTSYFDALQVEANKHSRLIRKLDGVTFVSEPDLVGVDGETGWSVAVHIQANEDGWAAMGMLKTAGADIIVEGCEPVGFSEFDLKIGVLWECSEAFNDALREVVAVEQWLAKISRPRVHQDADGNLPPGL